LHLFHILDRVLEPLSKSVGGFNWWLALQLYQEIFEPFDVSTRSVQSRAESVVDVLGKGIGFCCDGGLNFLKKLFIKALSQVLVFALQ